MFHYGVVLTLSFLPPLPPTPTPSSDQPSPDPGSPGLQLPPALVSRQPSAGPDVGPEVPGDPQAKRPKMEEDGAAPPIQQQQPVIVAMSSQPHDNRK